MKLIIKTTIMTLLLLSTLSVSAAERQKLNFNGGWLLHIGDMEGGEKSDISDAAWRRVTLPRAWNDGEAFKVACHDLSDTIVWYRKHFTVDNVADTKYLIEFEGVRFGADFYLNGHHLGLSENGVMASGFDLTPYVIKGENVIAVRVDNSWEYREKSSNSRYQWNDKNFNANYGGIPKNVWLHRCGTLYQTLPLYSNLGTVGTYVYGSGYDIAQRKVNVNVETQIANDGNADKTFFVRTTVKDVDGRKVLSFDSQKCTLKAGGKTTVKSSGLLSDAHFWSWGYGYLYDVETAIVDNNGNVSDVVTTRTGFRKTRFAEGKIWLNDRVLMMHGYAQRTSNEWPYVGMSVPAWLSDYSNNLLVESGGNIVRWMHVTPWKQDVESCDRVGLIQAMPAGDAEKDVTGRRWEHRVALMRDAIIYNRNNPSILFYEGGNESISREHMIELRDIRDKYDPNGGRAIGSREMLDIAEAEYGGEMLYVNKSATHPMWMMEYHRDEGLRKYWDEYSYPFHKEGEGPLYRGKPAPDYNHNMDIFARSMVERWYDYWLERPGTGKRVNSGGAKIVFSDTNTHWRGEVSYRTSGVTDAMRIPKDAFYVHQVMWDGWVEPENDHTYIVGHWNYDAGVRKPVYVVSNADSVALFVNGRLQNSGVRSHNYLFTFDDVAFEPGKIEAVSYRGGNEVSRHFIETAGEPFELRLTTIENPEGFKADGADLALVQVEVVDRQGRRCPLDNRIIDFHLWGEGQLLGGIAAPMPTDKQQAAKQNAENGKDGMLDGPQTVSAFGNYVGESSLPVDCGVNRVFVRSTVNAGDINLTASAKGLKPVTITLHTNKVDTGSGMGTYNPALTLNPVLTRGETPLTPSYTDVAVSVDVVSATAGSNIENITNSYDDNELSEWKSDGKIENAWVTYNFGKKQKVDEVVIKLTGWRNKCYPLAIYSGKKLVWKGATYATLGAVHIPLGKVVDTKSLTIKMLGPSMDSNAFGDTKELAGGNAGELDRFVSKKGKVELRIVEVEFKRQL